MLDIICINIFFRPEEAMFDNWQKLCLSTQNSILFLRKYLDVIKQNEKYPLTVHYIMLEQCTTVKPVLHGHSNILGHLSTGKRMTTQDMLKDSG